MMNKRQLQNPINNNADEISSRRKFLKQMAYGSILALSGSGIVSANVRDIIKPSHHGKAVGHAQPTKIKSDSLRSRILANNRHEKPIILPSHKTLYLANTHTGDKRQLTYFERGRYVKEALNEINYLLRDHHTDDIHPIDTALLDQLHDLRTSLNLNKPFHIVCGYRSPTTNSELRRHSSGVAEHSFHMQGRAIDIRVEGLDACTIKNAALAMARGGVGYYPESNFVHIDTGDIRTW